MTASIRRTSEGTYSNPIHPISESTAVTLMRMTAVARTIRFCGQPTPARPPANAGATMTIASALTMAITAGDEGQAHSDG